MFLPLTDLLTCPHCGPEYGLILLADQIEDRRVLSGALGCPNCQRHYPVTAGFVDLRKTREEDEPKEGEASKGKTGEDAELDREEAIRLAALLGLTEGMAQYLLILGPAVRHAPAIAALGEGIEILVADPTVRDWEEEAGISRLGLDDNLPIYQMGIRGAVISAGEAGLLSEVARVLVPGGRVVIEPVPDGIETKLEEAGLEEMVREGETLVAVRA